MAEAVIAGFIKELRSIPAAKDFAAYWEANYAGCYDKWLRVVYLARLPEALWHRIPTGTQHGESGFGKIKQYDFAALCVPPSLR